MKVDIPGIGGSLGECVACGKPFTLVILTGGTCRMIQVGGIDCDLPVHEECIDSMKKAAESGKWEDLPEGPLRKEFERCSK